MKTALLICLSNFALTFPAYCQNQTKTGYEYATGKSSSQISAYQDSVIKANSKAITWAVCACENKKHEAWQKDMNWAMTYKGARRLKTVSRFSNLVLGKEPGAKTGAPDMRPYWQAYSKCVENVSIQYIGHYTTALNKSVLPEWNQMSKGITATESSKLNYSIYPAIAGWVQRGVMTR